MERSNRVAAAMTATLSPRLREKFDVLAATVPSPLEASPALDRLVWVWRLVDLDGLRDFLTRARADRGWKLLDVLAWWVSAGPNSSEEMVISRYSDISAARDFFDLSTVRDELRTEVENVAPLDLTGGDLPATAANRRAFALNALKLVPPRDDSCPTTTPASSANLKPPAGASWSSETV
ncbi:MAG: hypothetical protein EOO27_46695 [Comamonadaceae bacterium]|nr:MAG: hypothetical protein EOO27_46695 [Comamonadaceae bacterium]